MLVCLSTHARVPEFMRAFVHFQGGMGVIGGVGYSPKILEETISELKSHLENKDAPFGVDLLIPQVGGNARKTNVCQFYYFVTDYKTVRRLV